MITQWVVAIGLAALGLLSLAGGLMVKQVRRECQQSNMTRTINALYMARRALLKSACPMTRGYAEEITKLIKHYSAEGNIEQG